MNESIALATILIIAATALWSFAGFRSPGLLHRHIFGTEQILRRGEYERLVTSGFLHADIAHLFFNMFSLYSFGAAIERTFGAPLLITVYFAGIVGGNLISLMLHRREEYYALGASGGVCGVIYAAIFLIPGGSVIIFPAPIPIPSYLYAVIFILVSWWGMQTRAGNIGHDAHLGGAVVGLLAATAFEPGIAARSPVLYAVVMALSCALFVLAYRFPSMAGIRSGLRRRRFRVIRGTGERRPTQERSDTDDRTIDELLEKISREGFDSLTAMERKRLEELSKRRR